MNGMDSVSLKTMAHEPQSDASFFIVQTFLIERTKCIGVVM